MAPPPPKTKTSKTLPRSDKYYTINAGSNKVFGVRVDRESPTLMVGFKNHDDALLMGRLIETYYIANQELPLAEPLKEFILPSADQSIIDLKHLTLLQNDTENLIAWCTVNFLDFLGVEEVIENKNGKYSWDASLYSPEASFDLYKERLDFLFEL